MSRHSGQRRDVNEGSTKILSQRRDVTEWETTTAGNVAMLRSNVTMWQKVQNLLHQNAVTLGANVETLREKI